MKQTRKNFFAAAVSVLFAFGILCASLVAPAGAMASQMPDCSSPGSVHPCQALLCNLAASHNPLSQGALVSTRSYDSGKDGLLLLAAILPISSHGEIWLAVKQFSTIPTGYRPEKVPIHLFNSVLTL